LSQKTRDVCNIEFSNQVIAIAEHEACSLFMQGPSGCQQMLWRNQPGGYLREILTARVYDVAVRLFRHAACLQQLLVQQYPGY
jgi:hypothetical protein